MGVEGPRCVSYTQREWRSTPLSSTITCGQLQVIGSSRMCHKANNTHLCKPTDYGCQVCARRCMHEMQPRHSCAARFCQSCWLAVILRARPMTADRPSNGRRARRARPQPTANDPCLYNAAQPLLPVASPHAGPKGGLMAGRRLHYASLCSRSQLAPAGGCATAFAHAAARVAGFLPHLRVRT